MPTELSRRQFAAGAGLAPLAQGSKKPNILIALSDDHSAPYVGVYGNPVLQTPNLDRFAREGMRFDKAFQIAPQCVPARTGLMTGRSPVAVRMGRFSSPLPPDIVTLPELLRDGGYTTGVFGRYFHLDGVIKPGAVTEAVYNKHNLKTWEKRVDFLDRSSPPPVALNNLGQFLDQRDKKKPFFAWINFSDPHHVWDRNAIPKPHDPKSIPLPPHLPDLPGMRDDLGRYFDEIGRLDGQFQNVLNALADRKLTEDTIVLFMGDNGMAFPHGKGSLYDPGLNVPLFIRWPGVIRPNQSSSELISGEDIAPTLLDAAGLRPHPLMSGRSFHPLLRGQSTRTKDYVFGQRLPHGNSPFTPNTKASTFDLSRCVRSRRHKLIYNCTPQMVYQPVDSANDAGWKQMVEANAAGTLDPRLRKAYFTTPRPVIELYDLEKDPSELENVAGQSQYSEIERELLAVLQERMILDYDHLPPPMLER